MQGQLLLEVVFVFYSLQIELLLLFSILWLEITIGRDKLGREGHPEVLH